jgi:protease I
MTVSAAVKLRSAVTATGGAGKAELAGPVRALREAGGRAGLVSIKPGQLQAVRHDLRPAQMFAAGTTPDQGDPADYDALLLPGGAVSADRLRAEAAAQSVIKQADGGGRPMAVICHPPPGDWSRAAWLAAGP